MMTVWAGRFTPHASVAVHTSTCHAASRDVSVSRVIDVSHVINVSHVIGESHVIGVCRMSLACARITLMHPSLNRSSVSLRSGRSMPERSIMHAYTNARTKARTHARKHTHTHTHTHTQPQHTCMMHAEPAREQLLQLPAQNHKINTEIQFQTPRSHLLLLLSTALLREGRA